MGIIKETIAGIKQKCVVSKSRINARLRGRMQPDFETVKKTVDGLRKQLVKEVHKKFEDQGFEKIIKDWYLICQRGSVEQSERLLNVTSRMAIKYALDYIGLSSNFDSEKRQKVQAVFQKNIDKVFTIASITNGRASERATLEFIYELYSDLENILGPQKARDLITRYLDNLRIISLNVSFLK